MRAMMALAPVVVQPHRPLTQRAVVTWARKGGHGAMPAPAVEEGTVVQEGTTAEALVVVGLVAATMSGKNLLSTLTALLGAYPIAQRLASPCIVFVA